MKPNTTELKSQLLHMANVEFPKVAKEEGYPIYFNHCFLRVVYDTLFEAKWQNVFKPKGSAIHALSNEQLTKAVAIGEKILSDRDYLISQNEISKAYRK